jgi:hypothetical protein
MVRQIRATAFIVAVLSVPLAAAAAPIVIDFESLTDSDSVTTQFPGLTFFNATVLTAGVSLNELEFPPRSGQNVVFDDGGALTIDFASPVSTVAGSFTYGEPLTLTAYDAAHNLLGSVGAGFFSNLALSGDSGSAPNEWLQFASSTAIASLVVSGDPSGGSFVLDDLTYDAAPAPAPVPEPGTLSLLGFGGALLVRKVRKATRPCSKEPQG